MATRGLKVLQANIAALLLAGMSSADEVILTGSSGWLRPLFSRSPLSHSNPPFYPLYISLLAGGLATYIHADYVNSMLPSSIKYHALADAG